MNPSSFAHLHLHSEYSLLDGACRISDIPKAAKSAGHTAVALTDHGNMFGAVDFYCACKEQGVQPILGCEVYVAPTNRFEKNSHPDSVKYYHLVLLVKNEEGYRNLIDLVSRGYTEGFYAKPRIDLALLEKHHEGLIALSGCLAGYIPRAIMNDQMAEAESHASYMQSLFGEGNYYLELQDHGLEEDSKIRKGLLSLSKKLGIPTVATNDVHYLKKEDAEAQQVLMCIQTGSQVSDGRSKGFENDEFYYKTTEEMEALFSDCKEAVANAGVIADKCHFDFDFKTLHLPTYHLPEGVTSSKYLQALAEKGLKAKADNGELDTENHSLDDYKYRMIYEMMIISKMGYCDYYLIVHDFVTHAKECGIPTGPGRGSGAGSLVAFLVGITEVDSIRHNLLFERFLNPERISMPDFDIDFCYNRRDEVIRYVEDKYGKDHVAQIAAFGTLAARAAVRDVGRALSMPYSDVDRIAKLIPKDLGITISQALEREVSLSEVYRREASARKLLDLSMAVEGMPRHITTHAAGLVITQKPVSHYVPLTVSGETVLTQFDMNTVAKLGLLKFDFLALRYLTIIAETEQLVQREDPSFHIASAPLDDAETFALLSRGDTDGLFQLESAGMKRLLMAMKPQRLEDIMVAIALYRPGPKDSIPKFLENRSNPGRIQYEIDAIREILEETSGCIIYQEQVMQIFRKVAGYSYGKADVVRKAMSKKHRDEMEREREGFLSGAAANYIDREAAGRLFDEMAGFASYAFNKSHAAAYSYLSYRTAYLKTHYRAQYTAALLSSVLESPLKMAEYISDCEKAGIHVLPPDVSRSMSTFSVVDGHILYGLAGIKHVGEGFAKAICTERVRGTFLSFQDFLTRMNGKGLNRQQLQALIYAGAFDGFGQKRSQLLESCDLLLSSLSDTARRNIDGQTDLFADCSDRTVAFRFPDIPEIPLKTKLLREKEMTGLCFSGSFMDAYSDMMATMQVTPIAKILHMGEEGYSEKSLGDKDSVTVCGIITGKSVKKTKKGETVAFLTLEDAGGSLEILFFREVLTRALPYLNPDQAIYVKGSISTKDDEAPKLLASTAGPLADNDSYIRDDEISDWKAPTQREPSLSERTLYLRLPSMSSPEYTRVAALSVIFSGPTKLVYFSKRSGKYYISSIRIAATDFVLRELGEILGEENVILK